MYATQQAFLSCLRCDTSTVYTTRQNFFLCLYGTMRALYDMYSTAYLVPGTWYVLSLAYRGTVRPLYDAYNTAAFFPVYRIVNNRRFSSAYGARNVYLVHVTVGVFRLLSTMVRSSNIPGYTIQQAFFPLVYATSISHRTRQTLFPL